MLLPQGSGFLGLPIDWSAVNTGILLLGVGGAIRWGRKLTRVHAVVMGNGAPGLLEQVKELGRVTSEQSRMTAELHEAVAVLQAMDDRQHRREGGSHG